MQLIVLQACWANVREWRFWARPKSRSSWLMAWCWCFTDCCGELCADAFQFDREKLTNMLQEEHDQLHQLLEKYKEKLLKIGVRSHSLSSVLPFSYVGSVTDWVCDVRSRSAETVIAVKLSKMTNGSWRRWWTTQVDDKVGHLTADTAFLELWHHAIFEVSYRESQQTIIGCSGLSSFIRVMATFGMCKLFRTFFILHLLVLL